MVCLIHCMLRCKQFASQDLDNMPLITKKCDIANGIDLCSLSTHGISCTDKFVFQVQVDYNN